MYWKFLKPSIAPALFGGWGSDALAPRPSTITQHRMRLQVAV